MNVLIIANDYKPRLGGIAELSSQVATGLQRLGHQITVATESTHTQGSKKPDRLEECGGSIRRILEPMPLHQNIVLRRWLVGKAQKSNRAAIQTLVGEVELDCLICTNFKPYFRRLLEASPVPYCLYFHGDDVASLLKRGGKAFSDLKACLMGSRVVFFNSHYSQRLIESRVPEIADRSTVTGCGVALDCGALSNTREQCRDEQGWSDKPVLLSVCRQHHRKGIDLVIRALKRVRQEHPGCQYAVVGDGPHLDDFKKFALEHNQQDNVQFFGRASEELKAKLYRAADVYVMPSRAGAFGEVEGFGISFLEANASGLPVVGTNVGGIPDAVAEGVNGFLVPSEDVDALALKISVLLQSPKLRKDFARAGRERIADRYNWPTICRLIEERLPVAASV